MKSRLICGLGLGVLCVGLSGCPDPKVELVEAGDPASRKRVLIAARGSRFKNEVTRHVVEALRDDKCYVKVVDLDQAGREKTESYGAVLVLNACRASNMERRAKSFLSGLPDGEKDKTIVLTTTRTGWEAKKAKVDAISSASKMEDAASLAETLVGKVRAVLIRRVRP